MQFRDQFLRVLFLLPLLIIAAQFSSFVAHVKYFLSGGISESIVTGNWWLVAVNIVLFLGFLGFLRFRESIDWTEKSGSMGIYAAFIVSLFVEMYGVPLTIFLGSGIVSGPAQPPATLVSFTVFGTGLAMNLWMLLGVAITAAGMALVAVGWWQVYQADGLVTDGLYRYSRNPQYAGIILIAFGWVIGWPTVLTLALFPFVVGAYYHLARVESGDMYDRFGDEYTSYADQVPILL